MATLRMQLVLILVLLTAIILSGCGASTHSSNQDPPLADFSLNVSSQSLFVPIGFGSSTLNISAQPMNGFSQSVTVSITGLPPGVSMTPASPFPINVGMTQKITFSAKGPATVQNVTVQGSAGSLSHSASFALSVANPGYAYIAMGTPGGVPPDVSEIDGFAIDANTGNITPAQGSPTSLPNSPTEFGLDVASEPGGVILYVLTYDGTTSGAPTLSSFKVDAATGALSPVQTITYPVGTSRWTVLVHPTGKFLYIDQDIYTIDPITGNLTQASSSGGGAATIAAPGNFAYAAMSGGFGDETMFILSVDQNDGSLTLLNTLPHFTQVSFELATDPLGHALYNLATSKGLTWYCGGLFIWSIDPNSGSLTSLTNSFGPVCLPMSISFTLDESFVYVTNVGNGPIPSGIFGGRVDPSTGNLTNVAGSPFATTQYPSFGSVEPSQGKFLIELINPSPRSAGQLVSYSIDPSTGTLSQVSGAATPVPGMYPQKMVVVAPTH